MTCRRPLNALNLSGKPEHALLLQVLHAVYSIFMDMLFYAKQHKMYVPRTMRSAGPCATCAGARPAEFCPFGECLIKRRPLWRCEMCGEESVLLFRTSQFCERPWVVHVETCCTELASLFKRVHSEAFERHQAALAQGGFHWYRLAPPHCPTH